MSDIKVTPKQRIWLNQRDRIESDVEEDEKGLFIWMNDANGIPKKIYLPD